MGLTEEKVELEGSISEAFGRGTMPPGLPGQARALSPYDATRGPVVYRER